MDGQLNVTEPSHANAKHAKLQKQNIYDIHIWYFFQVILDKVRCEKKTEKGENKNIIYKYVSPDTSWETSFMDKRHDHTKRAH